MVYDSDRLRTAERRPAPCEPVRAPRESWPPEAPRQEPRAGAERR